MNALRQWAEATLAVMQRIDEVGGEIDQAVSRDPSATSEQHIHIRGVLFECRALLAQAHTDKLLSQIDHLDERLQALAQTTETGSPR